MIKAFSVVFVVISLILIEPFGNESTVVSYSTAIAINSADLANLEETKSAASMHCLDRLYDEVISFSISREPPQIIGISCRG